MQSFIDFEKLEKLSKGDEDVSAEHKVIKLMEESGELAQAFLAMAGSANASKSASQGDLLLNFLEEACDVLNVTIDMINNCTRDNPKYEKAVRDLFGAKLNKWESKQDALK